MELRNESEPISNPGLQEHHVSISLANFSRIEFPVLINWMGSFPLKEALSDVVIFHFDSIF